MITLANARCLVVEANAVYDVMLAEGCWDSLALARHHVEQGQFSIEESCLCAVAECRNPSPLQDIPDYRHLLAVTSGTTTGETRGELKRYFVAVHQQITKTPCEFELDPKIGYCALALG